jgi:hypothetical protein
MLAETYVHLYGVGTVLVIMFGYILRRYIKKKK